MTVDTGRTCGLSIGKRGNATLSQSGQLFWERSAKARIPDERSITLRDDTLNVAQILEYALFISAMVVLITGPFCSDSETQCPPKRNANRNRFLRRQKI
jgi:hypothetical protein